MPQPAVKEHGDRCQGHPPPASSRTPHPLDEPSREHTLSAVVQIRELVRYLAADGRNTAAKALPAPNVVSDVALISRDSMPDLAELFQALSARTTQFADSLRLYTYDNGDDGPPRRRRILCGAGRGQAACRHLEPRGAPRCSGRRRRGRDKGQLASRRLSRDPRHVPDRRRGANTPPQSVDTPATNSGVGGSKPLNADA